MVGTRVEYCLLMVMLLHTWLVAKSLCCPFVAGMACTIWHCLQVVIMRRCALYVTAFGYSCALLVTICTAEEQCTPLTCFVVRMQHQLDHMLTMHVRSSVFPQLEDAAQFIRALVGMYDVYFDMKRIKAAKAMERLAEVKATADAAAEAAAQAQAQAQV